MTASEILPYAISAVAVIFAAIYAGVNFSKNRKADRIAAATNIAPATWPEMWDKIDKMEKKNTALINVVEDLVRQWPVGSPRPVFDQADVAVLSGTIPSEWLHS